MYKICYIWYNSKWRGYDVRFSDLSYDFRVLSCKIGLSLAPHPLFFLFAKTDIISPRRFLIWKELTWKKRSKIYLKLLKFITYNAYIRGNLIHRIRFSKILARMVFPVFYSFFFSNRQPHPTHPHLAQLSICYRRHCGI